MNEATQRCTRLIGQKIFSSDVTVDICCDQPLPCPYHPEFTVKIPVPDKTKLTLLAKLDEIRTTMEAWPVAGVEYKIAQLERCIDEIRDYLRANPT